MKNIMIAGAALVALTSSAYAADMPLKAAPIVAVYSWNGWYIGGNGGYSWGRANTDQTDPSTTTSTARLFRTSISPGNEIIGSGAVLGVPGTFPAVTTTTASTGTSGRANVDGFIGGLQAGYNHQFDRQWLAGLEADFQYSAQRGDQSDCGVAGCPAGSAFGSSSTRLKWFGTFRGRVGYLPTDRVLLYATGGLAYGKIDTDYISGINGVTLLAASSSTWRAGWTVGAGVEGVVSDRWTLKAEYLYADYGSYSTSLGTGASVTTVTTGLIGNGGVLQTTAVTNVSASTSTRFTDSIFRVGANYRLTP